MYVATLPFFPLVKQVYDIEKIKPTQQIMMQLYPEIYSCIGCNACTKSCTQGLNVMQYIAYAQRGEYEKCAEESFDCVMCGVCSARCPAGNMRGTSALRSGREPCFPGRPSLPVQALNAATGGNCVPPDPCGQSSFPV